MGLKAQKFSPRVLLGSPRISSVVPNPTGDKIIYSETTYLGKETQSAIRIKVWKGNKWESFLITNAKGASEPIWIGKRILIVITGENKSEFVIGDAEDFEKTKFVAGSIDGVPFGLKAIEPESTSDSNILTIVFSAVANPDGTLHNILKPIQKKTSGSLYNKNFVRHWDKYITSEKYSIFAVTFRAGHPKESPLVVDGFFNILKKGGLSIECPIAPFPSTDHYGISWKSFAIIAKDPHLDPSIHTKQNLYISLASEDSFEIKKVKLPDGFEGATTTPVFSADGKSLAFLGMCEDGYESDKRQLLLIRDINELDNIEVLYMTKDNKGKWDRSPTSITWSKDKNELYVVAENKGNSGLYVVPLNGKQSESLPRLVRSKETISDVKLLQDGKLFILGSSLVESSLWYKIDPASGETVDIYNLNSQGERYGLSTNQISDIWWEGQLQDIHAWVVKPSKFDASKKYPLAYLIHGGPQGAWENGWSYRWNPAVFAEQGYVVILPNPTGSTGYGQTLTDSIQNEWGGLPYDDLVRGYEYISRNLDYIDLDRTVALGASYGGYMVNWIQGHDLGRKFKALVTHDGVFSMTGQLASDEQYFPIHDFGGDFFSKSSAWAHWDPARFVNQWQTPHLIIHSEKDYRLTIAEGLSAFNILQQKGVASQFLTFPDENHWVLKPENSLLWHAVVFNWINKHVGLAEVSQENWAKEVLEEACTDRVLV